MPTITLTKAEREWLKETRPEYIENIKGYSVRLKQNIGGATRIFTLGQEYQEYKQQIKTKLK